MVKPTPNLAGVLDNLPGERRRRAPADEGPTVMVGANLDPIYARGIALLHARTGRTKASIIQEAYDQLFARHGITRQQLENL